MLFTWLTQSSVFISEVVSFVTLFYSFISIFFYFFRNKQNNATELGTPHLRVKWTMTSPDGVTILRSVLLAPCCSCYVKNLRTTCTQFCVTFLSSSSPVFRPYGLVSNFSEGNLSHRQQVIVGLFYFRKRKFMLILVTNIGKKWKIVIQDALYYFFNMK